MYASHCLMHVGQLQLPIQHRVRAAAFEVYAAVQQGQGAGRQPVRKQQDNGRGSSNERRNPMSSRGIDANIKVQPSETYAASEQRVTNSFPHMQQQQPDPVAEAFSMPVQWQDQQQQRPGEDYVDEPWLQHDGYVPEPWEQQSGQHHQQQHHSRSDRLQEGGAVDGNVINGQWSPTTDVNSDGTRAMMGYDAEVDEVDADEDAGDDDVLWLLEDDSDGENQQQEQEDDGWLGEGGSSDSGVLTAAQQYASQQSTSRQHHQQRLLQQENVVHLDTPQPVDSSNSTASNPQAAWDAALSVAMSLLASYDVRFDVPRQPPFSSSSRHRLGGGGAISPEQLSLTAAAAAAAAKARHTRRQQVSYQALVSSAVQHC